MSPAGAVSAVFHRAPGLRTAVAAEGAWIVDAEGRRYLDACGGAIVNGVGHGRREVIDALAAQLVSLDYVHATTFTSAVVEAYAEELASVLPVDRPRVFPVSGGSEAAETAFKLARAYHLAGGEPERTVVLARWGSYHGNTLGALDASGRHELRAQYEPWLGRFSHLPAVNEYRCPNPACPEGCGRWHADRLEEAILRHGAHRVAAFVGEPIGGATLGACVPPDDYWPAVAGVCRRHHVLVIADEVMTGFGRTGRWFGADHWGLRPDIVVCAKGASSGYWPLGLCVCSGEVWETARAMFGHGYTFSHHPAGSAAGLAVLTIIREEGLVERSATMGDRLATGLRRRLADHPHVGEVRGRGLLVGIELVADRDSRRPFPPEDRVAEQLRRAAFERGVLVYPVTGCADGLTGDGLLLGPPLVVSEEEADLAVDGVVDAIGVLG